MGFFVVDEIFFYSCCCNTFFLILFRMVNIQPEKNADTTNKWYMKSPFVLQIIWNFFCIWGNCLEASNTIMRSRKKSAKEHNFTHCVLYNSFPFYSKKLFFLWREKMLCEKIALANVWKKCIVSFGKFEMEKNSVFYAFIESGST